VSIKEEEFLKPIKSQGSAFSKCIVTEYNWKYLESKMICEFVTSFGVDYIDLLLFFFFFFFSFFFLFLDRKIIFFCNTADLAFFFIFFHLKMPELSVSVFFCFFLPKNNRTVSFSIFFYIFLHFYI
jgi:hypothetical protein